MAANSVRRGQADGPHLSTLGLQDAGHVVERGGNLGMGRHVAFVEMANEADAQIAHPTVQHPTEAARRGRGTARVGRIVAGDRIQQQRVVGDGAGQRTDVVQSEGQRKDAPPRHQAIGRLQADDAAGTGRIAHRAAGIGSERQREQAGRDAGA